MPSKYGKQYAVPKEFPSVLKSFTREVHAVRSRRTFTSLERSTFLSC